MPWQVCSTLDERGNSLSDGPAGRAYRVLATFDSAEKAEAAIKAYQRWASDNDMAIESDCLFIRQVN